MLAVTFYDGGIFFGIRLPISYWAYWSLGCRRNGYLMLKKWAEIPAWVTNIKFGCNLNKCGKCAFSYA